VTFYELEEMRLTQSQKNRELASQIEDLKCEGVSYEEFQELEKEVARLRRIVTILLEKNGGLTAEEEAIVEA